MRGQSREGMTQHLAARVCWQAARHDERRVARRLYRTQVVDGVDRLDAGAGLETFCHCLQALGVLDWLAHVPGQGMKRAMGSCVQDRRRYGLKTWCGLEGMQARPAVRCSAAALMRLVGLKAHHVRPGACQRGVATRQRPHTAGPRCPDTLAHPHGAAQSAGPGGLVQRCHPGGGAGGERGCEGDGPRRWSRSGDDGAV